jgi:hypothetical protein
MDPVTIAASVVSVLAPYAIKGATAFGQAAGEVALSQAKKLIDTLKHRFSADPEAGPVISNFEKKPERYQAVLQDVIEEKIRQDSTLATDLQSQIEKMGPALRIIQEMDIGRNITAVEAEEMTGGSIDATQKIRDAEKVIGVKIKKIGS